MATKNIVEKFIQNGVELEVPSKTSDLTNDSGYITNSYHDSSKQDTLESGTNIKTINGNSVLGSGDLTISGLPAGGTNGQIIMMINGTPTWVNPADVGFRLQASDTEIDVPYVWSGTEAQYQARQGYDDDTEYQTF